MNNTEHIALVNGTLRRLESRKVLDALLADLKTTSSWSSPFGQDRRSEMGGDPPFTKLPVASLGPSGLGGRYQKEIFGPELLEAKP